MALEFKKATREAAKARVAFIGPPGSGKTYSSLKIATTLVPGGRIAVADSEHRSSEKYAPGKGRKADPSQGTFDFDILELTSYSPLTYVEAIEAAEAAKYDVLIIDSLSHAWMGKDGALEQVDRATRASSSKNKFTAWGDVTPQQNRMIDAMLGAKLHVFVTMRTKTEYIIEENEKGKKVPRKIGMAPVQRDGLEYEFDVVADMTSENVAVVTKSRCSALAHQAIKNPGADVAQILRTWLDGDADPTFVANEIARTTRGQELLRWADTVNVLRGAERVVALTPFIERWKAVITGAPDLRTLGAIWEAIGGMAHPLTSEVDAAVKDLVTARRIELAPATTQGSN